jgi:acetyl esterase/lipase
MLAWANSKAQPIADKVEIVDHEVTAADGTPLLARWYRLPSSDSRAAVVYLHGGGMILGSVPIFDGPVSRYVAHTGVPMLSIDYRLAPEHPHPETARSASIAAQRRPAAGVAVALSHHQPAGWVGCLAQHDAQVKW